MVVGRQTPGHFRRFCLFGAGLGGRVALGVVFLIGVLVVLVGGRLVLVGAFVMQQRPLPGQIAFLSISSHRREKNPVTQVPRHLFSRGISNEGFFTGFSFFGLSCFSTCTAVVVSAVSMISSSSSLDSFFSLSLLSLQRSSCFGMMSSSGVSSSSKIFFATQHLRFGLHRSSISKMASQKHEILSATQTPGQIPE